MVQTEHNAEFIFSKEGVAQGDPLSMLMYAAALMPLIQSLSTPKCNQNWYADDCACTADLSHLNEWFEKLCSMGPRYRYHPQPKKTVLIVDKEFDSETQEEFDHLGVRVVRGHRFLGGFIGDLEAISQFVQGKVKEWTNSITILSEVAQSYPQGDNLPL